MGIDCKNECPIRAECLKNVEHHKNLIRLMGNFLKNEHNKYLAIEYRPLELFPEDLIAL